MSDLIQRLNELHAKATPGPWKVWDSCSFRRITHKADGDVISGTVQQSDGHPDLDAKRDDLEFLCALRNAWPEIAAEIERLGRERDAAKAALHDWFCDTCQQRYSGPPDHGVSRSSCPKCGTWMAFYHEHRAESAERQRDEAIAALRAYERWEADLIMEDNSWVGGLPRLTQNLYDRMIELQAMRNAVLHPKADELPL